MAEQTQELDLTQLSGQQLEGLKKSLEKVRARGLPAVPLASTPSLPLSSLVHCITNRVCCRPWPLRARPRRTWRR